jgi:GntR family transcriptional regulator / MocR family aminotransferase
MHFRDLQPQLDPESSEPLAFQLAGLLAREIQAGRLVPGEMLPGSRVLSENLGFSRYVAMAALKELVKQGWATSLPNSGTYVSQTLPSHLPHSWGVHPDPGSIPSRPAFDLPSHLQPVSSLAAESMDLSDGLPDTRLAPKLALGKGYQRALKRHGDRLLGRGEPRGNLALREALCGYLEDHRGIRAEAENVLIVRDLPMPHLLIASALLPKGGTIAVEDPGNPILQEALEAVPGAHLIPLPVDEGGLQLSALEDLCSSRKLNFLCISTQHQVPTACSLEPARRQPLLDLAKKYGFAILEEDPEFEYYGPAGPLLPLASHDLEGRVIYSGSFSQLLAPGLGLGFLVAPKALVDRLARLRQNLGAQGDRVMEWALADLIRDGDFGRHLARARPIYRERREHLPELLKEILGEAFRVMPSAGGLSAWVHCPVDLNLEAWTEACRVEGVKIRPGRHYDFHGGHLPFFHLGFGGFEPQEMKLALQRMRKALNGIQETPHA